MADLENEGSGKQTTGISVEEEANIYEDDVRHYTRTMRGAT